MRYRAYAVAFVSGFMALCSLLCPWQVIELIVRGLMFVVGALGLYKMFEDEIEGAIKRIPKILGTRKPP